MYVNNVDGCKCVDVGNNYIFSFNVSVKFLQGLKHGSTIELSTVVYIVKMRLNCNSILHKCREL